MRRGFGVGVIISMAASCVGPEGGLRASFVLGMLMLLLVPSEVGYQDLAAFTARQPALVDRAQKAAFASAMGTIHEATLSLSRSLGTAAPGPAARRSGAAQERLEREMPLHTAASLAFASADIDPRLRAARLYFSVDPMGQKLGSMEPWAPGEEPTLESTETALGPAGAASFTLAALPSSTVTAAAPAIFKDAAIERADLPPLPGPGENLMRGGQTIAPKGEVTGADRRPMTPAELLNLDEKSRAKEEKCLAEAIYFEARGEAVRGQMGVAQVVLNRAFSGKYPSTVC